MLGIGIDIGSTATKIAVLDDDGAIVDTNVRSTGFSSVEAAAVAGEYLASRGFLDMPHAVVATGYGRIAVPFADKVVTEITCHGMGAAFLFGDDGVVIDVGGQDTKVIQLAGGKVKKFLMNDKCAAGTGRFLEIMADRLAVSQQQLADMAREGEPTPISSMCTVFAESEVISLVGRGEPRENIANGVIESVVERVATMASGVPGEQVFLTGGLCDNAYFVERLASALGRHVQTEPNARFAGAIGAAIAASRLQSEK